MTTYPMHYTDNYFSWRRVAMLWRLYWPVLKWGFAVCIAVPVVTYLLAALVGNDLPPVMLMFILWPANLLVYLAPALLAVREYRGVSSQLPVTATEKMTFLILTFWVALPAVAYLSGLFGNWLGTVTMHTSVNYVIENYRYTMTSTLPISLNNIINNAWWINMISFVCTVTIVMYYAIVPRHNRLLFGILSFFVLSMVTGIISSIVTSTAMIYNFVANGVSPTMMIDNMVWVSIGVVIVTLVAAATIYFIKLYKKLRNNGF